ncbi:hypothetical protein [Streptomyces sp. NPDC050546]|uniref:hypothetical protein n=1 Tax=Streptomyces sp. NPDC050546 TaxID=3365628 RepID=UPI0037AB4594
MVELPNAETAAFGELFEALSELRRETAQSIADGDYSTVRITADAVMPWIKHFPEQVPFESLHQINAIPTLGAIAGTLTDFGIAHLALGDAASSKDYLELAEQFVGMTTTTFGYKPVEASYSCPHGNESLDGEECLRIPPCPKP